MKATLSFTLPDDDGEFKAALYGSEALAVLFAIDQRCRSLIKHGEPSAEAAQFAEELRAMIPSELLDG